MMRLSSLVSDGMILQRDVENSIWGYGEKGRTVELSFENFYLKLWVNLDYLFRSSYMSV